MDVVEASRGLPCLVINTEDATQERSIGTGAPNTEGVAPATDNPTEMVAVGINLASIWVVGSGGAEIDLNHTVLPEVEQPDVQTEFGGETGKWSPRGSRIIARSWTKKHVVEEHGWCRVVVFDYLGVGAVHDGRVRKLAAYVGQWSIKDEELSRMKNCGA
jgi:hypothetical protein